MIQTPSSAPLKMEGLFAWSSMPSRASKKQLEDVRELFDELDHALKKFQMKTGADNQYITMILGAVMNDYRVKKPDISEFRWIQFSLEHSSGTMPQSTVNVLWRSIGSVLGASLVWKLLTDRSNALAPKTLFSNFKSPLVGRNLCFPSQMLQLRTCSWLVSLRYKRHGFKGDVAGS